MKPKFKVGDRLINKNGHKATIIAVGEINYFVKDECNEFSISFKDIENHFYYKSITREDLARAWDKYLYNERIMPADSKSSIIFKNFCDYLGL